MIIPVFSKTSFIYADEDDEEETSEKSDYDKCVIDKDKDACTAITKNTQNNLREIEEQIANAENDRDAARALAIEYASKAEAMQGEIDTLAIQIENLKTKIEQLEAQIAENETKVEALNKRVKNRMVESQKSMHFNGYL